MSAAVAMAIASSCVALFTMRTRASSIRSSNVLTFAVNSLGYDDPGLKGALHAAAEGLIHTSNLYHTAPGERLAAALVARSFASKVFFCNSGAEANEGAFKFARRWARTLGEAKHEIIALRGSFHGRLFGSLAATDRPSYRLPFRPLAPGISIFERDLKELDAARLPGHKCVDASR